MMAKATFPESRIENLVGRRTPRETEHPFALALDNIESWTGQLRDRPGREGVRSGNYFEPGDVLFGKLRPYLAKAWASDRAGVYIGDFLCLVPRGNASSRFLSYVLRTRDFIQRAAASSYGSKMPRIEWDSFKALDVPAPTPSEQRAIADYLDHETAEIDAFIADLDHFQELTTEHLKSLLNVLTLQPSSQDHHKTEGETVQLTRALPHRVDYRGATPIKRSSGIQLVTAGNVRSGWIDYTSPQEFVHTEDYADVMRRGKPEISDILLTMEAPLGNTALVDRTDIALAQRIVKFRASQIIRPTFAMLAMNSLEFQSQLRSLATGSTALGLKASKLSQLYLRVPGLSEQDAAVRQWSSASGAAQEMMSNVGAARELAVERRAALISAAVTGQIEVTKRHKPVAEVLEDEVRERV